MLHVICAIIEHQEKVLICQRSARMKMPLKWEFPGGKIEDGESKEACLKREIQEELGLSIEVKVSLSIVQHHYNDFSLRLYPFICEWTGGELSLSEHSKALWVNVDQLLDYDWAEADIPVAKEYLSKLTIP